MRNKVALAVSTALMSMSMSSVAELNTSTVTPEQLQKISSILAAKTKTVKSQAVETQVVRLNSVFTPEANLENKVYRYIVRLTENPVALYQGSIAGFKATSPEFSKSKSRKLDVKAAHVKNYRGFLNKRQNSVISQANKVISNLNVKQRTTLAFNGMVIDMTQAEAQKLSKVPGIAHIKREEVRYIQTDTGPSYIKADTIWDGSANGTSAMGEGMIVGVIDTGINTDHPSFADIGGDGYDHTNPNGTGVYSGDCATAEFASLCNDKLIGVHSWPLLTDRYTEYNAEVPHNGEDHDGHGSHTASTAAGNILFNVEVPSENGQQIAFEQMSGVAPHANIISYQICLPGDATSDFTGCYTSLTIQAVEHAIEAGVDAINYSIGGPAADPWTSTDSLVFLAARKAGIHVAVAAGNDGPGPGTIGSPADAPWLTSVGASTHNRVIGKTVSFTGGDSALAEITGKAVTGGFDGNLVYARDIPNINIPDDISPELCLEPYPAGTFTSDTIVLCDRGEINRVDKSQNVKAGGAGGFILANPSGTGDQIDADAHIIPAIHVGATDGDLLRAWLSSGSDHKASISETAITYVSEADDSGDTQVGRVAVLFSSRGANTFVPDVISPSIAAPGVQIFAALADDKPVGFTASPDPSDFGFQSGTSMASPHMAGALTLLASIHPDWTPAEAQSALMMTANQNVKKDDDGVEDANFFDMGAGFADLEAAAKAGLVMNESFANYMKANQNFNGVPSQMNLPSMAKSNCVDICSWTRTVKATVDSSWTAGSEIITDTLSVTVTPATFDLAAGETQELTITADASASELASDWSFANVVLTSDGIPTAKLPVAVKISGDNLLDQYLVKATRSTGSITFTGLKAPELNDIEVGFYDKRSVLVSEVVGVPDQDLNVIPFSTDVAIPDVIISMTSPTALDMDLYLLVPEGDDFEVIARSENFGSTEFINIELLPAGDYLVAAFNFAASAPSAVDDATIEVSSILPNAASLSEHVVASVIEGEDDFSFTVNWSDDTATAGLLIFSSADGSTSTQAVLNFSRVEDDVQEMLPSGLVNGNQEMTPGVAQPVSFEIAPNFTDKDKVYTLTAEVTDGQEIANVDNDGVVSGNIVTWTITRAVGTSAEALPVSFDVIPRKASTGNELKLSHALGSDTVKSDYTFGVVEVAPVAEITGLTSFTEGRSVSMDGSSSFDANADSLTYKWIQLSGTPVTINANSAEISFTAPKVSKDETISFQLTVDDGNGNSSIAVASASVLNKKSSGGSFGWLMLLLTPMLFTRRKKA